MSKHTPGPWEHAGQAIYAGKVKIAQCLDDLAADLYGEEILPCAGWRSLLVTQHVAEANAHLIAAAPELLEALQALIDGRPTEEPPAIAKIAHRNWELFQQARAAIAKAQGETA